MCTNHAALHSFLTINDQIGRLIRWRIRLVEFDFEVNFKKGTANNQADALSGINNFSDSINREESDETPVSALEELLNVDLELNKQKNYDVLIDVDYAKDDALYATMHDTT